MEKLPNELLLDIINQLSLEGSHGLLNISLVNKRLHRLTNKLIYSTFSFNGRDPALFVRTLASWPAQARYVQEVDWDCRHLYDNLQETSDAFRFDDLTPTELRNISQGLGSEKSLNIHDLNKALRDNGTDSYLSLFLSFTPHIRTIRVAIPSDWNYDKTWFKPSLGFPVLSNLSKASIIGPLCIDNVVPLFLLPSLRTLSLDYVVYDGSRIDMPHQRRSLYKVEDDIQKLREQKSGIENFHVQECAIDTWKIAQLVGLCRRLETFDFEYRGHGWPGASAEFEDFLHAVTYHSSSLTSLSLRGGMLGVLGLDLDILRQLNKLEHTSFLLLDLELICPYLENISVESLSKLFKQLPRRLQRLQLIANNVNENEERPSIAFSGALLAIAPTIRSILPALQTLEIIDWDPLFGTFTCQIQLMAMYITFAKTGVRLLSKPYDLPESRWRPVTLDGQEEDWMWVQWG